MITEAQAQLIAATLQELRPGDWRTQQVLDVLWKNRETIHDFKTLIQVAINAALAPNIKSPTGIFLPGKHWNIPTPPKTKPTGTPCEDHEGEPLGHSCSCCWAEINAGERPETMLGKRTTKTRRPTPPGEEYKRLRREIRTRAK